MEGDHESESDDGDGDSVATEPSVHDDVKAFPPVNVIPDLSSGEITEVHVDSKLLVGWCVMAPGMGLAPSSFHLLARVRLIATVPMNCRPVNVLRDKATRAIVRLCAVDRVCFACPIMLNNIHLLLITVCPSRGWRERVRSLRADGRRKRTTAFHSVGNYSVQWQHTSGSCCFVAAPLAVGDLLDRLLPLP